MDKPRALVIDDHKNWCDSLSISLRRRGFDVDTALTFAHAMTLITGTPIEKGPYDLATVDLIIEKRPTYAGAAFELIERLLDSGTAVVIVTEFGIPPLVDNVFSSYGFLGFLDKYPWSEDRFEQVLQLVTSAHAKPTRLPPEERPSGYKKRLEELLLAAATTPGRPSPRPPGSARLTWLHLSDLHQLSDSGDNRVELRNARVVLDRLMADLRTLRDQKRLLPDFVLFSGDVAYSGQVAEYKLAATFFDELLQTTDLSRDRLFMVPGNHDVDRRTISPVLAAGCLAALRDRDSVARFLDLDSGARTLAWSKFEGYKTFTEDFFGGTRTFDHAPSYYVQTLAVGGLEVAVLGLNSAWMSGFYRDRDGRYVDEMRLLLGEAQVSDALKRSEVQSADVRIALMHHPLDLLQEFDIRDVRPLLYKECEFVLHGHRHDESIAAFSTPYGSAALIATGACYNRRPGPNTYHFIQFDPSSRRVTVTMRRYSDQAGGFWAADTLSFSQAKDGEFSFLLP